MPVFSFGLRCALPLALLVGGAAVAEPALMLPGAEAAALDGWNRVEGVGWEWFSRPGGEAGDAAGLVGGGGGGAGAALPADRREAIEVARGFLRGEGAALGLPVEVAGLSWRVVSARRGVDAWHVALQPSLDGVPFCDGEIRVNLDGTGVFLATSHLLRFDEAAVTALRAAEILPAAEVEANARRLLRGQLTGSEGLRLRSERRVMQRPEDGALRPVWRVFVDARRPRLALEADFDAVSGEGVAVASRILQRSGGLVFDPNPVVVSGDGSLRDGDNVDPYRSRVELLGLDDSGYLRGEFVDARNRLGREQRSDGRYVYSAGNPHFEEVMVYYHLDHAQRYIQSLGIKRANNRQQVADAHGTSQDNSWYDQGTKQLTFGDGGVNDASDADIILHEYGHAIHDNITPGFSAVQTSSLSEGFGDYLAGTLTEGACIADWDATSYGPPCLRSCDNDKIYPDNYVGGFFGFLFVHENGMIWSGACWDLRDALGADLAAQHVIGGLFFQPTNATFEEAALAQIVVTNRYFGGAYEEIIRSVHEARGIL